MKKIHSLTLQLTNCMYINSIYFFYSTDAGVHAFHSTLHTDLERLPGSHYQPQSITLCLNKYFRNNDVPIRALKTYLVPNDFNCRFKAISRTYLYRLCVIKTTCENLSIARGVCHIPMEETNRCMFLW